MRFLTPLEVAETLKISRREVYYLISQREIPAVKIGRAIRIKEKEFLQWLEKNEV